MMQCHLQEQYKFIYETLVEYTRGIDSRFPVSELANKIKERGVKDKKTKKNAYQMEYGVRIECGETPGLVPQLPLKCSRPLFLKKPSREITCFAGNIPCVELTSFNCS